ncbi:HesA/MoeB/ThiF family protein [Mucilaginibacter sp. RS28]|uniref:HesA/MoeB/ThiF family protein n=1 Tax=Mucilaginibacter straminoryzae TaxID=2932774 RepID=A0A9X1X484_9SPHI|nr:HesA/MoeB/ThiF family protein [Mucilaginibacter straminoryzae]MCJ8210050.1 HesA/MoeB/ThiF family protein [Mucilaginibacter straminoryzae]
MSNRYIRQEQLAGFGKAAQHKLREAKVLVVGAGGLGVPVLQYLTGMGIGTIGIMDGDQISLTNLHRQVLYAENEVGQLKAIVAVNKLCKLNSEVKFNTHTNFLDVSNALEIIVGYDLVIDASDNFGTRYLINDTCVILNKPFVYGAVQQFEGHVGVFNYQGSSTYRCLYPNPPIATEIPDCNTAGVLGITPSIVGSYQALQAVKVICGLEGILAGQVQIFDFLSNQQYILKVKTKPENLAIKSLQRQYDTPVCEPAGGELTVTELLKWQEEGKPFLLLDVREQKEFAKERLAFAQSYPLSALGQQLDNLQAHLPMVAICEIGGRSSTAVKMIRKVYPSAIIYHVIGGMEAWLDEIGDQYIIEPHLNSPER